MLKALTNLVLAVTLSTFSLSAWAKDIEVKGYTKKDGTVVKGYTRHVKDKDEKAKAVETKAEEKANGEEKAKTIEVKGYTKKDGTKVKGYTKKVK